MLNIKQTRLEVDTRDLAMLSLEEHLLFCSGYELVVPVEYVYDVAREVVDVEWVLQLGQSDNGKSSGGGPPIRAVFRLYLKIHSVHLVRGVATALAKDAVLGSH